MNQVQRYQVKLDGTGGVFTIDNLNGSVEYKQAPHLDEFELRYLGVRLIVPYVISSDLEDFSPRLDCSALKSLEFANDIMIVIVPKEIINSSTWQARAKVFQHFVQETLDWQLLIVPADSVTEIQSTIFTDVLTTLRKHRQQQVSSFSIDTTKELKNILVTSEFDIRERSKIEQIASTKYTFRDYSLRRLTSFVEYYADHPVAKVIRLAQNYSTYKTDGNKLISILENAITARKPFSFVRVGEGEGCFLSYGKYSADKSPRKEVYGVCAKDIYRVWFDRNIHDLDQTELSTVSKLFWDAINNADVIGMPTPERVLYEHMHFVKDMLNSGLSRGYVGISEILLHMDQARQLGQLEGKVFTDCDIARPLYEWQDWNNSLAVHLPRLLKGRQGVTFITCHNTLQPAMARILGLKSSRTLSIPPEKGRIKDEKYLKGDHFKDHFKSICESLKNDSSPIVIVAAGFLGKAYCEAAKSAGSVAIDIGSLADYWAGLNTRQKNSWTIPSPFHLS
nr:hypothetical protein [Pseudomonas luteola]